MAGLLLLAAATADARPMDVFERRPEEPSCVDSGIRVIGRWSYGRARSVDILATADDTLLFLARGAGVTVARVRTGGSLHFERLSDINCSYYVTRVMVVGQLLCVRSNGIEFYDISEPGLPQRVGWLDVDHHDYWCRDTFCYTAGPESLSVYSIADPTAPRLLGSSPDPGRVICVAGGFAYLAREYSVRVVDVSDPQRPACVGLVNVRAKSLAVRDTFLYVGTESEQLQVYSVADPSEPRLLGSLGGIQTTYLCMRSDCDSIMYTPWLQAISVADPSSPRLIGQVECPGWDYWVAVLPARNYAFTVGYFEGLVAVDIRDPTAPVVVGQYWAADGALDVCVDGNLAYLACYWAGLRIVDISNPNIPVTVGAVDTISDEVRCWSVAVADSFVYTSHAYPWFRSYAVRDPSNPELGGACRISSVAMGMEVRDSLVYAASAYRLTVLNVARPREPFAIGTCALPNEAEAICLVDTLALIAGPWSAIVNISDPASPRVLSTVYSYWYDVSAKDTVAFAARGALLVYSIADPEHPREIDTLVLETPIWSVQVVGARLYLGTQDGVRVYDASDIHNMREVGRCSVLGGANRVCYSEPYLYVAAGAAGMSIVGSYAPSLESGREYQHVLGPPLLLPNPTRGEVRLRAGGAVRGWRVIDVTGRVVMAGTAESGKAVLSIDLRRQPPGVYCIEAVTAGGTQRSKVIRAE